MSPPGNGRVLSHRAMGIVGALLVLAVLAPSCTSEPERRDLPDVDIDGPVESSTGAPSGGPAPTVPSDVATLPGRLAVLDAAGDLVAVDPDGSDEALLDDVEPGLSQVRQPSWSLDGSLAWVHLEATDAETVEVVIATSTGTGERPTEAATTIIPFYLSWDPTSSRIAYLGPSTDSEIALGIVEVAGDAPGTTLETGRPFYLSWAPGGDQLLVHVGGERLERLGLDGSLTTVAERPGAFTTPVWTDDGRSFVYASAGAQGDRLVVHDVEAERGRPLVPFDGLVTFVVSPDGERIAFQVLEEQRALPLTVIDVGTGETVEITDTLTAGYFWSPDGQRLLYLNPVPDEEAFWYRWGVWDGTSSFVTPRFVPSLLFVRDYLQFFEQYAQSLSLWSPDGSAFAYPGQNEDGEQGIWIQAARPDRAPVLVAEGAFVAWSPA